MKPSPEGAIDYKPPSVAGKETNLDEIFRDLSEIAEMIALASVERDQKEKNDVDLKE